MADVARDAGALGQEIAGVEAGDHVTLVWKKPKPQVDATPAKRAAKVAGARHLQGAGALDPRDLPGGVLDAAAEAKEDDAAHPAAEKDKDSSVLDAVKQIVKYSSRPPRRIVRRFMCAPVSERWGWRLLSSGAVPAAAG